MTQKQQQLTFDKGITNVPSDILCSDNALEESVGMIYDDGEHRVIQKPVVKIAGAAGTILYIHKFNNQKRYIHIVLNSGQYTVCFSQNGVTTTALSGATFSDDDVTVTSIGKTLILNHKGDALKYFIWDDETGSNPTYLAIGSLPDPTVKFWLESHDGDYAFDTSPNFDNTTDFDYYVYNTGSYEGIIADNYMRDIVIEKGAHDKYDDLTIGLYSKNKKAVAQKKGFCKPFFARYALEMYDGTYTHVSNPVLLLPSVTKNSFSLIYEEQALTIFTRYCHLHYSLDANGLDKFSDVVKGIVVFVSDGIDPYDTTITQPFTQWEVDWDDIRKDDDISNWCAPKNSNPLTTDGIYKTSSVPYSLYHEGHTIYAGCCNDASLTTARKPMWIKFDTLAQKPQDEIIKGLQGLSVFYKLCDLGLNDSSGDIAEKVETHTLENLTTQEQLQADDYYSRSPLIPGFMYAYNSRLNLANVARGFFKGFNHFIDYEIWPARPTDTHRYYDITVRIKGDTRNYYVKTDRFQTLEQMGLYFYYPDSRADYVWIRKFSLPYPDQPDSQGQLIFRAKLEEHSGLNGAYYFSQLPGINGHKEPTSPASGESYPSNIDNNSVEILPNYIITSEVNNPWVFAAEGYNKVGVGKILGMSTTTMALSQDQFGRTDLMVFTDNGIWGMQVDNTGLYQSIHPFSREVCNNPKSITQTDGAVFFSSEKGLMIAWDGGVKCVSEQLSGKESQFAGEVEMGCIFHDFLKDCFIAYDYRDSLLWMFQSNRQYNPHYCYVYSIKSGTFGKFMFDAPANVVVNDYPDYLIQAYTTQTGNTLYSLTDRPDINDDNNNYSGLLITRPLKLENGLALKSIMQIKNIRYMEGSMTLRIFASNDLNHWVELRSLRGAPWKYYRFRYDLSDMKATDRFGGSVLITQERRTDKLR